MNEEHWKKSKRAFQIACLSASLATAWAAPGHGQSVCNGSPCPVPVPEPATLTLLVAGGAAAAAFHKMKSKKK